jgi:hypothetical protein
VLEAGGVTFEGDVADSACRLSFAEPEGLL